jgi:diguanylate cyclase (GGDEF)-like protein
MQTIQDTILNCIRHFDGDNEAFISQLHAIMQDGDNQAHAIFFKIFVHLDLTPETARTCWNAILQHRLEMMAGLKRDINLRTVICDYFCSVDNMITRPVSIELFVLEKNVTALKKDALTGLHTSSAFMEALSRELSRAKRYESDLSLLFLDLDDFKAINDTCGHLAGDLVLKDVSRIVREEIRIEDFAARYGDTKIVIILPLIGKTDALVLGERIRKKVESLSLNHDQKLIQPTVSGGVASYPIDAQHMVDMVKCADSALYRAKALGKNNTATYSLNKRRYLRINFFNKIQVRKIGFTETCFPVEAVSKNISVAGLLFQSNEFIEFGTKIELRISIPSSDGVIVVIGVVVRVEFFHSTQYDIGVSFLDLDKDAKQEISRYMIRQLEIHAA